MKDRLVRLTTACAAAAGLMVAMEVRAQVTPAAGYTPPDDTPRSRSAARSSRTTPIRTRRRSMDADGNAIHPNAFNLDARLHQRHRATSPTCRLPHHARHRARDGRPAAR